jgi:Exostosin family
MQKETFDTDQLDTDQRLDSENVIVPQIPPSAIDPQSPEVEPLEFWVSEELFHPDKHRPVPLLMDSYKFDKYGQLLFWNLLRETLPGKVKVHFFKNIEDAGPLVITPHDAKENLISGRLNGLRDYNRKILATGRSVVTFAGGIEYKPLPGEIVFATSTYRTQTRKAIPLPTWLYDMGSEVTPIAKPEIPNVFFDGNVTYSGLLTRLSDFFPLPDPVLNWLACSATIGQMSSLRVRRIIPRHLRKRVLNAARKAPNLQTAFAERDDFFAMPFETRQKLRLEYINGMQTNAYALSIRGDANGDFRMYEIMSAGRIPVIIDNNLMLPHLEGIKWEEFSVTVPYSQIHRIGEYIQKFHDSLSEEEFQNACRKARMAFDQLLPHNYIDFIIKTIRQEAKVAQFTSK